MGGRSVDPPPRRSGELLYDEFDVFEVLVLLIWCRLIRHEPFKQFGHGAIILLLTGGGEGSKRKLKFARRGSFL